MVPTGNLLAGPSNDPDRYELITRLGSGGEGEVWLAMRQLLDGPITVAVKHYRSERFGLTEDVESLSARLETQAARLRQLAGPGFVTVHESFTGPAPHRSGDASEGRESAFFVMDYIEGTPFDEWLVEVPNAHQRLGVLNDPAAALDELHRAGQVHADIKGSNIVVQTLDLPGVSDVESAVLVDFGVMRAITTAAPSKVVGSAGFLAPELAQGASYTPASDLYAFARVCAGALSVEGNEKSVADAAREAGLPEESLAVLLAGLDPSPEKRSAELYDGISGWLSRLRGGMTTTYPGETAGTIQVSSRHPEPPGALAARSGVDPDPPSRRSRAALLGAVAVGAVVILGLLGLSVRDGEDPTSSDEAATSTSDQTSSSTTGQAASADVEIVGGPTTSSNSTTTSAAETTTTIGTPKVVTNSTGPRPQPADPGPVDLSGPVQLKGTIDKALDQVLYEFEGKAGDWISADVVALTGGACSNQWAVNIGMWDENLEQFDPAPAGVGSGCSAYGPWILPEDGSYTFAVWSYSVGFLDQVGDYEIILAKL